MTDEAALQAALVADASSEVMMLVRSNDIDLPDPATMAALVASFLLDGARLWLEGHCWGFGCTSKMLRYLATSHTFNRRGAAGSLQSWRGRRRGVQEAVLGSHGVLVPISHRCVPSRVAIS